MAAHTFRELAELEETVAAFAAGGGELVMTDGPVPDLPPADAPHAVVRAICVPFHIDEMARRVAAERHCDPEDVLAEWMAAGAPA